MSWRDITSYSRADETEERVPSIWELKNGNLTVTVHRWVGIDDTWFVTCRELAIDRTQLPSRYEMVAKRQAIARVKEAAAAVYRNARGLTLAANRVGYE